MWRYPPSRRVLNQGHAPAFAVSHLTAYQVARLIEAAPAQGCAQQSRLVPRPGPFRDRPQWVQLGVGRRVRVLHRHAGAEFDMLADSLAKRFVARHAGLIQGRHVELDEACPLLFSNMEAAVYGDQMGEPELPAEPVRPAKRLRRKRCKMINMLGLTVPKQRFQQRVCEDARIEHAL